MRSTKSSLEILSADRTHNAMLQKNNSMHSPISIQRGAKQSVKSCY